MNANPRLLDRLRVQSSELDELSATMTNVPGTLGSQNQQIFLGGVNLS